MTADRFAALDEAFWRVIEAPEGTREAALREVSGGDAAMEASVRLLVRAHESAGSFLEGPPPGGAEALAGDPVGKRFGAYESVGLVGAGGMGAVHRCRRVDDQFEKLVAVKVIHRWFDTREILERFAQERRVLAPLQHPNIAMLLDAGVTEDGSPYIVMEHVDGAPIDEHCDRAGLGVRDRVRLFLAVCEAVGAAHRSLVVHLDLKPSNILVTADGLVKLVDFGIARVLDDAEDERGRRAAFTPAYAAPEQAEGGAVSVATDVYALGAVLYRLLAGVRPHAGAVHTGDRVAETVASGRVAPPSRAASAGGVPADLDAIVLKAMSRAPGERYGSAAALAEDLARFLEGRVVEAAPAGAARRAVKFARRNPVGVAAGVALFLALAGGTAGVAWQAAEARRERDRAEQRFEDLRRFTNVMLSQVDEKLTDLPGAIDARRVIVSEASAYLDSLAGEVGDDPGLLLEVAASYVQLANIQRNMISSDLGDTALAGAYHEKAMALRERALELGPGDALAHAGIAESLVFLGDMARARGDLAGAVERYAASERHWRRALEGGAASETDVAHSRAVVLIKTGIVETTRGELANAQRSYERALRLNTRVLEREPERRVSLRNQAVIHEKLGEIMELRGDAEGAYAKLLSAHEIYSRLAEMEPDDARHRFSLAVSHSKLGEVLGHPSYSNLGDLDGAVREYRRGEEIVAGLIAAAPEDARARSFASFFDRRLGTLLAASGDHKAAIEHQLRAHESAERVLASNPTDVRARTDLAAARAVVGGTYRAMGDDRAALGWYRRAIAEHRALLETDGGLARVRQELAVTLRRAGESLLSLAEAPDTASAPTLREAESMLEESVALLSELAAIDGEREMLTREHRAAEKSLAACRSLLLSNRSGG